MSTVPEKLREDSRERPPVEAIQRFRTIEEMAAAPVVVSPGEGFDRFARHCARYWSIAPRVYPRGFYRFGSLAEAQAARERVTQDNIARRWAGS